VSRRGRPGPGSESGVPEVPDVPDGSGMPEPNVPARSRPSGGFIGYPVNRMLAVIDDAAAADAAAAELRAGGVPARDITMLRGEEGARRLDGTGSKHGAVARTRRVVAFTLMDQLPDLAWYERAVRDGAVTAMVGVRGEERKAEVLEVLRRHGAHFINYYGRFATQEIDRWRGPEPPISPLLKR
jgi:hypothetical protein